jgi:hypothetical protein
MKARQGDIVELRAPAGVEQIEVLGIRYGVLDSSLAKNRALSWTS